MKKRIFTIVIALLMLIVHVPVTAQGSENLSDTGRGDSYIENVEDSMAAEMQIGCVEINYRANAASKSNLQNLKIAKERLIKGIQENKSVDMFDLQISTEDLHTLIQDIRYDEPQLFYFETCSYSYLDSQVYTCFPIYSMPEEEIQPAVQYFENEIDRIVEYSGAMAVEDDLLQALLLHDYIVTHFEYDLTYSKYDAYTMLKDGSAVCQGYTLLYKALLDACGVECTYAVSEDMNHIWNLVKIEDNYYHVDATWDDPIENRYWRAGHDNFMKSDAGISAKNHYNWTSYEDIVCGDTEYDDAMFTISQSAFAYCEGYIYYIDNSEGTLCRYVDDATEGVVVADISDIWHVQGQSWYYPGTYSGLVSVEGKLYFNSSSGIGSYDPETDELKKNIVSVDASDGVVIGVIQTDERTLSYGIAPAPFDDLTEIRTYVIPKEEQTLLPTDVNRDGVLNISDVNELLVYLANANEDNTEQNGYSLDVNNDGRINIDDLNTVLVALATA